MALKASSEFQSIVLSTLVKDADLLSRVVNHVDINYFDKPSYRYIFNNLCMYYNNYGRIPNMESLIVLLKDNYNTSNSESLVDIIQEYENLYNTPRYEPEFVVDKLQIFIKRAKVEKILSEVMPEVQKGKEVLIENLGVQLSDALDFSINRNNSFKLSDIDKLQDMRLKAVGDDGNSLIIKSFVPKINESLQFKGYKPGDIVMIVSPPGCFTGKTRVMTLDGEIHTIEELYNKKESLGVYSSDYNGNIVVNNYDSVTLTKYTDHLVEVTIEDEVIECTPDHKWLMRDGSYKSAIDLKEGDSLMSISRSYRCHYRGGYHELDKYDKSSYESKLEEVWSDILNDARHYNHKVRKVREVILDEPVPVYDIVDAGPYSNYAIAVGEDTGVFVHNCGKTMFCINECASAALQGFNVLHMFIGDMTEYDGFIRYVSNISNMLQDDLVSMPLHDQYNVVKRSNYTGVLDRISVASYSASELTVNELVQEVDRLQLDNKVHYDLIAIDYADNLIPESDMLYKSGGDIYNKLSELGRRNRSTLLVASQPKTTYWDTEIIPKEGAAESAKKQHVVDLMITMNRYNKIAKFGTIFLPKVRRGTEGALIRWRSEFEKARLSVIDNLEYNTMKAELSQE